MVNVNNLSNEINKQLGLYAKDVEEEIRKAEKSVSSLATRKLKVAGDFQNNRTTRNYRTGWRSKRLNNGGYVVYNATSYQLTHLLEFGHALKNGGRARAFPHIGRVEAEIQNEFEKRVREALRWLKAYMTCLSN